MEILLLTTAALAGGALVYLCAGQDNSDCDCSELAAPHGAAAAPDGPRVSLADKLELLADEQRHKYEATTQAIGEVRAAASSLHHELEELGHMLARPPRESHLDRATQPGR